MKYILVFIIQLSIGSYLFAVGQEFERGDQENVKYKMYPKSNRLEWGAIDYGQILNQAFIKTYLLHTSVSYFSSEKFGYSLEGSYGINRDRSSRKCLETFYNNQDDPDTSGECDSEGGSLSGGKRSNYGPAYLAVREINYLIAANLLWNPVYGKQIVFMSAVSHFDLFTTFGAGMAMSTYYPESTQLRDGRESRPAVYEEETGTLNSGAASNESQYIGEEGRPDSQEQVHPYINVGIGQKLHFLKHYHAKFEFRNMTLLGTPGGFENLLSVWIGLGLRI